MFEQQIKCSQFQMNYIKNMAADLTAAEMVRHPVDGTHTPGWILGHIAIISDVALRLLEQPLNCPDSWRQMFGKQNEEKTDPALYPTKEEMLAAIEKGHMRVAEALANATPELLAKPHNIPVFAQSPFKTVADGVAMMMTTHEALHMGQLSYWRRTMGRKPLF